MAFMPNGGCFGAPDPQPCGPGQPCFGSVCLPIPQLPVCIDPFTCTPCCGPPPCEPPQMMVAYRKPFCKAGKEEYQCYPCFYRMPKRCDTNTCPELQFNPFPPTHRCD